MINVKELEELATKEIKRVENSTNREIDCLLAKREGYREGCETIAGLIEILIEKENRKVEAGRLKNEQS